MSGPGHYASESVAAGYASGRPAIHPAVIDLVRPVLDGEHVAVAVDVGCGAGASTRPLTALARRCLGVDPSHDMIQSASRSVPEAAFVVGTAERLPFSAGSVDLITAAGSLDYADFDAFSSEANRVLSSKGLVVAYDFARGRRMRGSSELDAWYNRYLDRCGRPIRTTDMRATLAAGNGLRLDEYRPFTISIPMDLHAYVAYVMTDARNPDDRDLRQWCEQTLESIFTRVENIEFDGYLAFLNPHDRR